MEINATKIAESTTSYPSARKSESVVGVKVESTGQVERSTMTESGTFNQQTNDDGKGRKELNKDQLMKMNNELNHFMSAIDSDIQFTVHEKSKQLMVQVIDSKDHKVIKEFPSNEMLNIMANIREYVGALLDKRV